MSRVVGTYVIKDVAVEVHGDFEMFPIKDEDGKKVNTGYDFYDIYSMGGKLDCLVCLNEGHPFTSMPTQKEVEDYLESIDYFTTLVEDE